ncbi:hypothetical protein NE237_010175 [Protea cynaroides]|uniref:Uncharacterized protein n=1 Tax=Protea cynaroides TaxID=273540 RepID=A0A9Q0R1F2_9MAGN|nr:hypothetical protein NE237_010175 [Protea cynaroides]
MAPCKPVKVIEQCTVAPPPGSVPVPVADIPLTFFDQLWLPLPPPQTLHFYDYPYPSSIIIQSLIPLIKLSLSCTLTHFYPLAGKLSWPHDSYRPIIRYEDGDSVSVTVVESDADFDFLTSDHPRDVTESHPLVPYLQSSGPIVPVLAIQITVFPNFGLSIGMTNNHSIMDGRAVAHFMKIWASISKYGDVTKSVYDQEPAGIEKKYLNQLETFMGAEFVSGNRSLRVMDIEIQPDIVRATMELNPTDLRRLKDWILARQNKVGQPGPTHTSTYVVSCAFAWVCLLKAEEAAIEHKPGNNKIHTKTSFWVNVDCRARMKMDPPIPGTYFGNCVKHFFDGIIVASQLIGEGIRRLDKGVLSGLEDAISNLLGMESVKICAVAGSPRSGLYGVDYGWGRPKKVEFVSNDRTGAMFVKESPKLDGGIEIDFALNKKEMDAFVPLFNGLSFMFD